MIKSFFSVSAFILIFFGIFKLTDFHYYNSRASTMTGYLYQINTIKNLYQSDSTKIPVEILFPSTVGEVTFPHQIHFDDFEITCVDCHHQINAQILITPHSDYFKSSWIKCQICHKQSGEITQKIYTCSECHHPNPSSITDETLSSKVVIHKKCWECHEVNTGSEASEMCSFCHSGGKKVSNLLTQ